MMVLFFFVLAGALPVYASPLDPPYEYNPDAYCQSDKHPNHIPVSKNMVIFTTDKWSYIVPKSIFGIYGVYFTYADGCITLSSISDQLRKNNVAENDILSIVTGFKLDAYHHHTDYCRIHGLKKDARFSDLKKHFAQQEEQSRKVVCVTIEQAKALNERAGDAAPGVVTQDWQTGEWYRIIPTVDMQKLAKKRKKAEKKAIAAMAKKEAIDQEDAEGKAIAEKEAIDQIQAAFASEQSTVTTDDDSDAQAEESTPL